MFFYLSAARFPLTIICHTDPSIVCASIPFSIPPGVIALFEPLPNVADSLQLLLLFLFLNLVIMYGSASPILYLRVEYEVRSTIISLGSRVSDFAGNLRAQKLNNH